MNNLKIKKKDLRLTLSNSLITEYPTIASEWHPTKNGDLTPYCVTPKSNKKVWWMCKNRHEWEARIDSRAIGRNCPYCSGKRVCVDNCLATIHPHIAKDWHPTKNKKLTPFDFTHGSEKKVWWLCSNGHDYMARICNRTSTSKQGCPICIGKINKPVSENSLLSSQWNYKKNKNMNPNTVTCGSSKKAWWICSENHEWQAVISSRSNGSDCPFCSGRYATNEYNLLIINPKICGDWDYNKNKLKPEEYMPNSSKKVWWKCSECLYEWNAPIVGRNNGTGCPCCNISKGERRCEEFFKLHNINFIYEKKYKNLTGVRNGLLSYDFYLPKYNLLIEYQGEQHARYIKGLQQSEKDFERQQEHDKRKREYAIDNNINLLEIWYYEFDEIEEILTKEISLKGCGRYG